MTNTPPMERLKMHTPDLTNANIAKLAALFPVLKLPVCGLAYNPQQGTPDAGPIGDGGPPDLANPDLTTGLECKAVDTQAACHK